MQDSRTPRVVVNYMYAAAIGQIRKLRGCERYHSNDNVLETIVPANYSPIVTVCVAIERSDFQPSQSPPRISGPSKLNLESESQEVQRMSLPRLVFVSPLRGSFRPRRRGIAWLLYGRPTAATYEYGGLCRDERKALRSYISCSIWSEISIVWAGPRQWLEDRVHCRPSTTVHA